MKRPVPPERCVFCDKDAEEWHHVAGRNHCSWFVVKLCRFHHQMVTKAEDAAGINRAPADTPRERRKRARQQCHVFLWILDSEEINQ